MASQDDATNIAELDDTIPADDSFVYLFPSELKLVKGFLATQMPNFTGVMTATHTELNKLDGATVTTAELNALAGTTVDSSDITKLTDITVAALDVNGFVKQLDATTKTTTFNIAANRVYKVDPDGGAFTATLPAGSEGIGAGLRNSAGTCSSTKYVRIAPQSGEKMFGVVDDYLDMDRAWATVHLIYDATNGWTFA